MPRASRDQAEQTRRDIVSAALRVFARQGYAASRLDDIAAALGVTRGAIYGHFASKRELFLEVIKLSQDPLYELIDRARAKAETGSPRRALRRFMLGWHELLVDNRAHRDSFELILNKTTFAADLKLLYQREKRLTADVVDCAAQLIERGIGAGELPGDLDAGFAGLSVYLHLMGVTQSWLFNPRLFSLRRLAEPLTDQVLAALDAGQPATWTAPARAAV